MPASQTITSDYIHQQQQATHDSIHAQPAMPASTESADSITSDYMVAADTNAQPAQAHGSADLLGADQSARQTMQH